MKKKVQYAILQDIRHYIKGINIQDFEGTIDKTDPEVIEFVREYYIEHLPVDLTAWARVNYPDPNLKYGKGLFTQERFVSDEIWPMFYKDHGNKRDIRPMIIGTHISNSVILPIIQLNIPKYGLEIVMCCDFYKWTISIASDKPVLLDHMGIFSSSQKIKVTPLPQEKVYKPYLLCKEKFTLQLSSNYRVYTFFFLLANYEKSITDKK